VLRIGRMDGLELKITLLNMNGTRMTLIKRIITELRLFPENEIPKIVHEKHESHEIFVFFVLFVDFIFYMP